MPKQYQALLFIVFAHFSAALLIGERKLIDYFIASWFAEVFSILLLPLFIWLLYQLFIAVRLRIDKPISFIAIKAFDDRRRFRNAIFLLLCFAIVSRSYRAIKVSIPRLEPYYLDTLFADIDRAIFGVDPWKLTHGIIGPEVTAVIDASYFLWFKIIHLCFAFCAFSRDEKFQLQSCMTYFLIWIILGNVLAVAMSAAGPCYYETFLGDDRFAPLMIKLSQMDLIATQLQAYLLTVNGDEAIGSGISAMPSLHCALTIFLALVAYRKFGFGWQFSLALSYHLMILVGSVHLGWHYAVDGLFSTAIVPLIWWVVGKFANGIETGEKEAKVPFPRHLGSGRPCQSKCT